jgi:cellulase/cellobiase CelA1
LTYRATGLPSGLTIDSGTGIISGTPTTAGSATVTVTAIDGTGASGAATFTWAISSTGTGGGGGCHVTYQPNQWQGGFTANVTVANTSSTALNGWTLTFTFPGDQKITSAWNGTASQSGENVSVTNVSYNGQIPAAGSTSFGFQGTWASSDTSPTSFSVNGAACD